MRMRINQFHVVVAQASCRALLFLYFLGLIYFALLQPRPHLHILIRKSRQHRPSFRPNRRRHNHPVRLHAPQFPRRKIHHHRHLPPNQFLRLIKLRNPRANLPNLRPNIHGSFSNLSAPTIRSAVLICPTRISTFAKSSIPIFSAAAALQQPEPAAAPAAAGAAAGVVAATGEGAFCASFSMASILSIASVFSILGNNACDLPSAVPGASCPHANPSKSTAPSAPDCPSSAQTFAVLSGKTGCVSTVTTRKTSAVVQSTVARRCCSSPRFSQRPRLLHRQILIRRRNQRPNHFQPARKFQLLVMLHHFADSRLRLFGERRILRLKRPRPSESSRRNFSQSSPPCG